MRDRKHLQRLVDRYLDHTATDEELEVFIYLQQQGELDELLDKRLNQQILAEAESNLKPVLKWLIPIAAAAVVVLVSSWLFYLSNGNLPGSLEEPVSTIQVMTGNREIKTIRLTDGTHITLNQNSQVRFLEQWTRSKVRSVELVKGEAFFDVEQTIDKKPFVVQAASGIEIRVLGTQFNVVEAAEQTTVYLHEGCVELETGLGKAALKPGELAEYTRNTDSLAIQPVDGVRWMAWKNNLFVFEDAGLTEVKGELEAYYGISIELPHKPYEHLRFTGTIPRKNMDTVLKVLSETLNLKHARQGSRVNFQIKPKY
ncbi:ferric-dicitrate binding protein FerR (iron transport regulator) [Dyadobacter jejuensis]|uniref:Ferric-dicitrate binding protein FerR (Iron transport regulator) n=1 Tax=Dyadobacter jejuensis TaxID=1082580 RepID=A0A316A851_9BACT|nr:FecR domain-containing protein [Dyadobacter jejuensis]PWJ53895.1 ferric-dicitrate binding protein FerR (iron transport regulator) [Dyadobacter jejuensis]